MEFEFDWLKCWNCGCSNFKIKEAYRKNGEPLFPIIIDIYCVKCEVMVCGYWLGYDEN